MKLLPLFALLAFPMPSQGQAAFDVISIKPLKGPMTYSTGPRIQGRTVTGVAMTVSDLVAFAYQVRYDQITGMPAWAKDARYDIEAKSEGDGKLAEADSRRMMLALLAERFRFAAHRETRDTPVYVLVTGKDGPKFHESAPDAKGGCATTGAAAKIHMDCKIGTMERLAQQLTFQAGRSVVDRTGLTGKYAFTLDYAPSLAASASDNVPDIFEAVREQLGLKLEPATAPIDKVAVDHAEKPAEN